MKLEMTLKEPVGRVYVLTNPRMSGLVKIGFTLGTVEGRARELDATGTPEPFEIAYQIEVRGPENLERQAHSKLINKRVRNSREFFEIDVVDAILAVRQLAIDPLDEEVHPKYLELVDQTAAKKAEERIADEQSRAQEEKSFKEFRYKQFVETSEQFRSQRALLWSELNSLKMKFESYPAAVRLNWLETTGLEVAKLLFWVSAFIGCVSFFFDLMLSATALLACAALFAFYFKITANKQKKDEHNSSILKMAKEIQGLEFDLERLDRSKPKLDKDLAQYAMSNPIRSDEQGFEPSAKRSGNVI